VAQIALLREIGLAPAVIDKNDAYWAAIADAILSGAEARGVSEIKCKAAMHDVLVAYKKHGGPRIVLVPEDYDRLDPTGSSDSEVARWEDALDELHLAVRAEIERVLAESRLQNRDGLDGDTGWRELGRSEK